MQNCWEKFKHLQRYQRFLPDCVLGYCVRSTKNGVYCAQVIELMIETLIWTILGEYFHLRNKFKNCTKITYAADINYKIKNI